MTKEALAQQLRERQYMKRLVERNIIDMLSDDDIIDSYVTCSCCGRTEVNGLELEYAINRSETVDEFFDYCHWMNKLRDFCGFLLRSQDEREDGKDDENDHITHGDPSELTA